VVLRSYIMLSRRRHLLSSHVMPISRRRIGPVGSSARQSLLFSFAVARAIAALIRVRVSSMNAKVIIPAKKYPRRYMTYADGFGAATVWRAWFPLTVGEAVVVRVGGPGC